MAYAIKKGMFGSAFSSQNKPSNEALDHKAAEPLASMSHPPHSNSARGAFHSEAASGPDPLSPEFSEWIFAEQQQKREQTRALLQTLQQIDLLSIKDDLSHCTERLVPFTQDRDLRELIFRNALGSRPSSIASAWAIRRLDWGTVEPLRHLRELNKSGLLNDSALPAMLKLAEAEERELLQSLLLNTDHSTPVFIRTAMQNLRDLEHPGGRTTLLKFVRHASDHGMIQSALEAGEALQSWTRRDPMLRLNLSIFVHAPSPVQSFLHVIGSEFLPSRIVLESLTLCAFKTDILKIRTLAAAVALTPVDPDLGAQVIEETRRTLDPAYFDHDPQLYDSLGSFILRAMHLPRPDR